MSSSPSPRRRRLVLTLAAGLVAGVLPVLPVTAAVAAPVAPAAVLLPAPTVTPTTFQAGTTAVVRGTRCVPRKSTQVYVALTTTGGSYVTSLSVVPASDGTWTARLTPSITTAAGSYLVSATCDFYGGQAPYRSRSVTVTASTVSPWTGQAPALPNVPNGSLNDVDCLAAPTLVGTPGVSGCVAVGTVTVAGTPAPLIEVWDGSTWTVAPVSAPAASGGTFLSSVDCTATSRCVAVGDIGLDTGHQAFVAQLAGSTWTSQVLAAPAGEREGSLNDVSCPTSTTCFAVGSTGALSEGSRYSADAYQLHGTTWTQIADPEPTSPRFALTALSCVNVKTCVAIGNDSYNYPTRPLAEVFDGKVWSGLRLPTIAPSVSPTLSDVTCATASSCVAVGATIDGNGTTQPLVETLTNAIWRVTPVAADPSVGGGLQSVSCLGARFCTAVGATSPYQFDSPGQAVAATLANGSWTSAPVDVSAGINPSRFSGVSCAVSSTCVAVGDAGNVPLAATATANGWVDMAAAAPDGYVGGQFTAVSCSAADACTAGGWSYRPDRNSQTPLVNRWNGTAWSLQALTGVGTNARLSGVACPSAKFCVAVGAITTANGTQQPLLQQWNGRVWKPAKLTLPKAGLLNAVSCSSATSCLAVGQSGQFNDTPLAVGLTGTTWKVTPRPPVPGLSYPDLNGVSCVAGAGCRVVGAGYDSSTFESRGIDLVWDGSTVTVGPEVANSGAVSCTGASACVAAGGFSSDGSSASVFDGTTWTREPLPTPGGAFASIRGVACSESLSCVVVGSANGAFIARRTAAGTWNAEPVTPLVPGSTSLQGVACSSASTCVAVGDTDNQPSIVVSPTG